MSNDGADLELAEDPSGAVAESTRQWLRTRLSEREERDWLAERWSRARGQIGDPAYPPTPLPEVIDGMVALYEVFPHDFDLSVMHGGHRYLIEDCYCVEPGCDCDQLVAHVVDLSEDAEVGHLRIGARRLEVVERHGPPSLGAIWSKLLERQGHAAMRDRFERMRRVARARNRATPVVREAEKIGRNDPCPCGSGKKHKRCCG